ncbi:MAG: GAF domain-containing protein, partial [Bacteroidales bacterium]
MKPIMYIDKFPFPVVFTLKPLLEYWNNLLDSSDPYLKECARHVLELTGKVPGIKTDGLDPKVLRRYPVEMKYLLSGIFSPYQAEHGIFGANVPYHLNMFYTTPSFGKLFGTDPKQINNTIFGKSNSNFYGPTIHAYTSILKKFYDVDASFDIPQFRINHHDEDSGLMKYYTTSIDTRFVSIRQNGDPVDLTEDDISRLLENYHDLNLWQELLPPERFVFEGFGVFQVSENTHELAVVSIQNKLLDKESIINRDKLSKIEMRIRSLLRLPDVRLGVAVFNEDPRSFSLFRQTWLTVMKDPMVICNNYQTSIYETAARQLHPLVVNDLERLPARTIIEETLYREGHRSMLIIPLHYEDKLVGLLELVSPRTGELSTGALVKMQGVLSAFGIAAKRQALELENQIKARMQEEFTAIHPSVEWKFKQVATEMLSAQLGNMKMKKKPIIFHDVYPLYGVCDVKSSSTLRNDAIQNDLLEQMEVLNQVIEQVRRVKPLPILDHLRFNLNSFREDIESDLSTGDEVNILDFIRNEVEPVLRHLSRMRDELEGITAVYFDMLDPELGVFYRKRKQFEESMRMINDEVGSLLDKREEEAQQMFPHYFEKYRTDGIEHSIYIGDSLVENHDFDSIYLKNLRLWQLITMCEITRTTLRLKPMLPMPLETTQLLLVHGQPLAIRFREDEKKFDVDGAYNLRYEITKKRIDKARLKGKSERIVQPGKIAIIYSQEAEKLEYLKYLEYMVSRGYLDVNIEHCELENLQGIYGLKAL